MAIRIQIDTLLFKPKAICYKQIDITCIQKIQLELIKCFYNNFNTIQICFNIDDNNIWNFNKHSINLRVYANKRILSSSNKNSTYLQVSKNRE